MADLGHELTDEMLADLEKKIASEYAQAAKDMRKKLREYMEQFEEGKAKQKALLDAGKITKKEYKDWCFRHTMMGQQWRDMKNVLAEDLQRSREMALAISRGQMADVYALNANYATYQIEHDFGLDTSFTLYNHDTAEYLLQEQRQLMPAPSGKKAAQIAADKALQWDMQHIQSAVLQGVLQGESPYDIAKRLRSVAQMDYNASVRYARTMTTSAQNAGRYQAYRRAKGLGVDLTIEWSATLDGRTRHDHRMMHGQRRNVDQPFKLPSGQEILYPADSSGDSYALQGEIWNCRCTLLAWVKGFEGNTVKSSPKMGGMSFEEWQKANEPKKPKAAQPEQPKKEVVLGDILKKSLSDDFDEFKALLDNAPDVIKDTYIKLSDKLSSVEKKSGSGWCSGRSITWCHRKQGNKWETLAHEYGHFVDNMIPNDRFGSSEISSINDYLKSHKQGFWSPPLLKKTVSSSDEFLAAMRKDRSALNGFVTDKDVRKRIRDELLGDHRNITTGIQDAFDGFWLTRSAEDMSMYLPWGHGGAYYNREYNRRFVDYGYEKPLKEAFKQLGFDASNQKKVKAIVRDYETASELWANVQAAKTVGGETLTLMEKYFPNACAAFDELVKAGLA